MNQHIQQLFHMYGFAGCVLPQQVLKQIKFINLKVECLQAREKNKMKTFCQISYEKNTKILHKYCHAGGRDRANPINSEKTLNFQVFAFL